MVTTYGTMCCQIGGALDAAHAEHGRITASVAAYEPGGDAEVDQLYANDVMQSATLATVIDHLQAAYRLAGALRIANDSTDDTI